MLTIVGNNFGTVSEKSTSPALISPPFFSFGREFLTDLSPAKMLLENNKINISGNNFIMTYLEKYLKNSLFGEMMTELFSD